MRISDWSSDVCSSDLRAEYSIVVSCLGTVAAGAVWRAVGRPLYKSILRHFRVSWSDDTPSAWSALVLENTRHRPTQISVRLVDGSRLHCTQMHKVGDYPFGPAILGKIGRASCRARVCQ